MVRQNNEHKGGVCMTSDREKYIKISAERLRRLMDNEETTTKRKIYEEDLEMLLDLILGGEAWVMLIE